MQNPSKIFSPNFAGEIGEVEFSFLTQSINQSNKFFHLGLQLTSKEGSEAFMAENAQFHAFWVYH